MPRQKSSCANTCREQPHKQPRRSRLRRADEPGQAAEGVPGRPRNALRTLRGHTLPRPLSHQHLLLPGARRSGGPHHATHQSRSLLPHAAQRCRKHHSASARPTRTCIFNKPRMNACSSSRSPPRTSQEKTLCCDIRPIGDLHAVWFFVVLCQHDRARLSHG